ncbi:DmsC/YnfH family molybdoenzyme membrane anchor subunit [Photobacterium kishitanii]|uniref:DmsC/YnfH family molybdoenzyme membrane anchor subunit n=1 Tax=Photobacterium kishitanii TaxID=318456 RepID=UPI000D17524E
MITSACCGHCRSHALQLLHSSTNKASSNAVSERATVRITFVFAAIIYWFIPRRIKARPILFTMLLSIIFILLADLTSRGIFYRLHMTVGV